MALKPNDEKRLASGAAHARSDFEANWQRWTTTREVAEWWNKWCRREVLSEGRLLDGTNHDRLGRILMEVTGVRPKRGAPRGPKLGITL
jgi:hypothetical protein